MKWAGIDFSEFANAVLALITAIIILAATKLGRKATPDPHGFAKLDGAAIISSESAYKLIDAITQHNLVQKEIHDDARDDGEKIRQAVYRLIETNNKIADELGELRHEMARKRH